MPQQRRCPHQVADVPEPARGYLSLLLLVRCHELPVGPRTVPPPPARAHRALSGAQLDSPGVVTLVVAGQCEEQVRTAINEIGPEVDYVVRQLAVYTHTGELRQQSVGWRVLVEYGYHLSKRDQKPARVQGGTA